MHKSKKMDSLGEALVHLMKHKKKRTQGSRLRSWNNTRRARVLKRRIDMATSTTCRRCGEETHMTRISMLDYYDLCHPCWREEDKDGILVVSQILKDRGYKE